MCVSSSSQNNSKNTKTNTEGGLSSLLNKEENRLQLDILEISLSLTLLRQYLHAAQPTYWKIPATLDPVEQHILHAIVSYKHK